METPRGDSIASAFLFSAAKEFNMVNEQIQSANLNGVKGIVERQVDRIQTKTGEARSNVEKYL